jgi:hypothetical protein
MTPDTVTIITGRDSRVRVRRHDIISMKPSTVSVMPEGLDDSLTPAELTDLLAFLRAQTASGIITAQNRPANDTAHP